MVVLPTRSRSATSGMRSSERAGPGVVGCWLMWKDSFVLHLSLFLEVAKFVRFHKASVIATDGVQPSLADLVGGFVKNISHPFGARLAHTLGCMADGPIEV